MIIHMEKNHDALPGLWDEGMLSALERLAADMPSGFFLYHATGDEELIFANRALIHMFGCDDLEDFKRHTGYTFRGLVHPDDYERVSESIHDQIVKEGGNMDYVEYRVIRKDGAVRWFRDFGCFIRAERYGDVFYVFMEDTTDLRLKEVNEARAAQLARERREALEELAHESTALRLVHEILNSGMWSMEFDERGGMVSVYWSDEFRAMLGFQNEADFPNALESWSDLLHEDDKERVLKEYYDTIADYTGKKTCDVEYRLLTKDRGWRWFRTAGRLSRRPNGTPITYVGIFVDITQRKRAEEAMETQRRQLVEALEQTQRANRSKTVFLSNMSHDIRTPMNAIAGFTTLASMYIDDKALVAEYLDKIMSASNDLLAIINDVLDMSRIENGEVRVEEALCDLDQFLRELENAVRLDVQAKKLAFSAETENLIHPTALFDRKRLEQALMNVLSNAIKFTPEGGSVSVRVSEIPNAPKGYGFYVFKVRDTGIGMSREFVKRIFEPFERERTSTQGSKGTGLGMTIAKNIVDMMSGNIQVESEEGKGTEVTVSVQFRLAEDG